MNVGIMSEKDWKKQKKVLVIAGRYKGKSSFVKKVLPKENKAYVYDVNNATLHKKGGFAKKELAIDLSNLRYDN